MAKRILTVITSCIAFSAVLILGDWINIAYLLGLDISSLNWDFIALLIGNIVVVALYLITYIAIDRNNMKRSQNQERTVDIFLEDIYSQCKEFVELIDNGYARRMAAQKCDFEQTERNDPALSGYQNLPFELEEYVFAAVSNGILSDSEFREYLDIRKRYKRYVSNRITFFDAEENQDNPNALEMVSYLRKKRTELLESLDTKLTALKTQNKQGDYYADD